MGHAGMPAEGDADGELLEQELLTLSRYLTRQMSSDPDAGLVTIVFAIDQAEELFRSDRDHAFQLQARRLTSIIARNRVPMIVIFSIRSDRFEKLQADPVLGNVRMDIFNLPPIPVNALREVIEGPARVAGLYIDPRLVERLLYDLGPDGVTDALPLLAFVLARLHQEASARSQIGLMDYQLDLMDYEELGGFRGAIELAIERALEQARVDPRAARRRDELERLLRLAFIPALVTIDPDTGLPRRRVTQLAQIPSEAHPLLKHLIQERLLVTSVEAGNTVIEIAHEAMLRQWGLLRGWLDEDLILLRVLEGVKRAARDWHLNDRNDAWLIHSSGRLEEAKRLYERPDFFSTLDSSDKVYLENAFARENAAQGRQRYRQRVVAMAAGLFLVIAVAATGAAFFAYTQRTLAENQRTLAEKQAIRATQQAMLADEQRARADAQMRLAEEANLRAGSSVSPDAERLLVLDADGRARIINLVTGQEIGRLAIDDGAITSAAFSPDGNKIVTTATNFDIGIWEAKTLKLLSILKGQATATRVVFSHDALLLASAGDENTVHLWSVATGESLFAIRADGSVTALAFSPDGTSLVISTGSGSLDFVDTRTGAVARRIRPSHH